MKLSVIIVSYNTKKFLKDCLSSVFSTTLDSSLFEVIVVDNASSDGTFDLKNKFKSKKNFKFIRNKKNLGFSKANNIGLKVASGKYILFLNPDTLVYPNTFKVMIDFMDKNQNVGAATCKVLLPNGELDDSCHRGFPTPWNSLTYFSGLSRLFKKSKTFSGYNLSYLDFSKPHEIDSLAGSFMFVRREAGDEAGWWDEDYFFYGEDIDFCYKLKEKGWKVFYVPEASALHYKGISGGIKKISKDITTAKQKTRKLATNERYKAMKLFYNKHYINRYPGIVTWLVFRAIDLKHWMSLKKI